MAWSSTRVMFADLVAMYRAQEGQWSAQRWEVRAPLWTLVECGPDYLSPGEVHRIPYASVPESLWPTLGAARAFLSATWDH